MQVRWLSLRGLIILLWAAIVNAAVPSGDVFTSSFLVRFKKNVDKDYAHEIANKYGYDNLGTVGLVTGDRAGAGGLVAGCSRADKWERVAGERHSMAWKDSNGFPLGNNISRRCEFIYSNTTRRPHCVRGK